jgi:hypothetical protein
MRLVCLALVLVWPLAACNGGGGGGKGGDDDDDDDDDFTTSENCTTQWECNNGVCECEDGTPCDDEDDCDEVCEVCE